MATVDIHFFQATSIVLWIYNLVIVIYLVTRHSKQWLFFIVPAVWISSNIVFYMAIFARDFFRVPLTVNFTFWSAAIRLFGASAVAGILTAMAYNKIIITWGNTRSDDRFIPQ